MMQLPFGKGGAKTPKSIGAATPLPSHEDHFRPMVDDTKDEIE
jgi:hypothetical protein